MNVPGLKQMGFLLIAVPLWGRNEGATYVLIAPQTFVGQVVSRPGLCLPGGVGGRPAEMKSAL